MCARGTKHANDLVLMKKQDGAGVLISICSALFVQFFIMLLMS